MLNSPAPNEMKPIIIEGETFYRQDPHTLNAYSLFLKDETGYFFSQSTFAKIMDGEYRECVLCISNANLSQGPCIRYHRFFINRIGKICCIEGFGKNRINIESTSLTLQQFKEVSLRDAALPSETPSFNNLFMNLLDNQVEQHHLSEVPLSQGLNNENTINYFLSKTNEKTVWIIPFYPGPREEPMLFVYTHAEKGLTRKHGPFCQYDNGFYSTDSNGASLRLDHFIKTLKEIGGVIQAVHFEPPCYREEEKRHIEKYREAAVDLKNKIIAIPFLSELPPAKKEEGAKILFSIQADDDKFLAKMRFCKGANLLPLTIQEMPFAYKSKGRTPEGGIIYDNVYLDTPREPEIIFDPDSLHKHHPYCDVTPILFPANAALGFVEHQVVYLRDKEKQPLFKHEWKSVKEAFDQLNKSPYFKPKLRTWKSACSYLYEQEVQTKIIWATNMSEIFFSKRISEEETFTDRIVLKYFEENAIVRVTNKEGSPFEEKDISTYFQETLPDESASSYRRKLNDILKETSATPLSSAQVEQSRFMAFRWSRQSSSSEEERATETAEPTSTHRKKCALS